MYGGREEVARIIVDDGRGLSGGSVPPPFGKMEGRCLDPNGAIFCNF